MDIIGKQRSHVAVIGGGITGVTTAYALARRGIAVTLLERHRYPAMETSFANGGQLSASNAEAWNHWSTVVKGLRWMARRDAPLLVHPAPGWHKLSWFAEFVRAIPHYRNNTIDAARMAVAARAHLFEWAERERIDFDLKQQGILHIYRDKAGFERAAGVSRLLAQGGLERRAVTPAEMRALEPTLQGRFYGGFYTESDASGDIHKFTQGLAAAAVRLGVQCRYGATVGAIAADGKGVRVRLANRRPSRSGMAGTDSASEAASPQVQAQAPEVEELEFDGAVICAGNASRALAAMVGDRVNVYPVKGYSITVGLNDAASRAAAPTVSLVDDQPRLVASRFGDDRLRVAGTAEFNGLNLDIRADRIRPLVDWVETCFPDVDTRAVVPWAGLRPTMPDMRPRVGPGRVPGVFYNTGHGHLGWTLAAATADAIGDMVAGAMPAR